METAKKSHRHLKICCGVTAILLISILVVSIVLFLTIFKPKQPEVIAHPVNLTNIEFEIFPTLKLNITLAIDITVNNRNYGSFKYKDTTAYVNYHGILVGEAPIERDTIPARGKHDISISAQIFGDKLTVNPYFPVDFGVGSLNFTSITALHGEVAMFKILKLQATAHSTCAISVFVGSWTIDSICSSKLKL